ncbi:hypothetical protein AB0K49_31105 [Streptomyces decoyicus]|uniref:hypothetical protein n=1 Tax=Streptomyces decoyicus TaxID=249567 RepID=UPI00345D31FA
MDPAVIAALITTPTAVLAAIAAYAAGRAQSRGTVDGAVLAARAGFEEKARDAQRAAHLALIDAAHVAEEKFLLDVDARAAAQNNGGPVPEILVPEGIALRMARCRVELEGPGHLIELADALVDSVVAAGLTASLNEQAIAAEWKLANASLPPEEQVHVERLQRFLLRLRGFVRISGLDRNELWYAVRSAPPWEPAVANIHEELAEVDAALNHPVIQEMFGGPELGKALRLRAMSGPTDLSIQGHPDALGELWTCKERIISARHAFTAAAREYLHAQSSS